MLARVLKLHVWPCVCLCLSQVGVLSKRLNESSWLLTVPATVDRCSLSHWWTSCVHSTTIPSRGSTSRQLILVNLRWGVCPRWQVKKDEGRAWAGWFGFCVQSFHSVTGSVGLGQSFGGLDWVEEIWPTDNSPPTFVKEFGGPRADDGKHVGRPSWLHLRRSTAISICNFVQ